VVDPDFLKAHVRDIPDYPQPGVVFKDITPLLAAPLLAWWKEKEPQYRALADRRRRTTLAAASASTGVPVVRPDDAVDTGGPTNLGVPGPPAVPRTTIQARARQQRRKKRR